jgi:hypothetical protein
MRIKFQKSKKKISLIFKTIFLMCLLIQQTGCKKLVDINNPPNALTSDNVYTTDATAAAVLTGIYTNMSSNSYRFVTGTNSLSILNGLSSDELTLAYSNALLVRFYTNKLLSGVDKDYWVGLYNCLINTNTALERLESSNSLTTSVKQQLIGEAKFIRGFCHFYLVNLFGDVPLALTSDYRTNSILSRTPKADVYQQIIKDLKDAKERLSETYLDGSLKNSSVERVRPTKWAAAALLARVYLYIGDWASAETEAANVISNSTLFSLNTLDKAFLRAGLNNKEAIWQLQPVNSSWNTEDAKVLVLNFAPGFTRPFYLDTLLVKSFEVGDGRRSSWTKDTVYGGKKYSYAFKYKVFNSGAPVSEYLMVLRLAEQFLIRAEARAQLNKLSEAITDLDKIRQRAGLTLISVTNPGISKAALIDTIMHERQVELFTEWGHRWFDLKRTSKLDAVMNIVSPLKGGGAWNSNWALFPIPSWDILYNSNMTQNPGY